jgi:hypothetical protein
VRVMVGARPRRHRGGIIYEGSLVGAKAPMAGEVTADG